MYVKQGHIQHLQSPACNREDESKTQSLEVISAGKRRMLLVSSEGGRHNGHVSRRDLLLFLMYSMRNRRYKAAYAFNLHFVSYLVCISDTVLRRCRTALKSARLGGYNGGVLYYGVNETSVRYLRPHMVMYSEIQTFKSHLRDCLLLAVNVNRRR